MTLFRQLIIAVLILFIALYGGNLAVSLLNARTLVDEQMQVHAQDTATSLALTITQAAQDGDLAALDTYFNAIADSGFFQRIVFTDLEGQVIVERDFPVSITGVPPWFIKVVDLSPKTGSAEVSSNWMRMGIVTITSHPGQAYRSLWDVMVQQLLWFALVTVLICCLGYGALHYLLLPLRRVEAQANAICNQDFAIQENIPKTRELRQVVVAMNRMAGKLKQIFDNQLDMIRRLQLQSYRDPVTGISNRADFDNRLNSYVKDERGNHSGALMIFAIADFAQINDIAGRAEGNNLLRSLANILSSGVDDINSGLVARRQGPDFSVFLPDIPQDEAEGRAEKLFQAMIGVEWVHRHRQPLQISMGFTYSEEIINGPELLSEADMALQQARTQGGSYWCKFSDLQGLDRAPVVSRPALEWKTFIETCIEEGNTALYSQDVFSVPYKSSLGREVFVRFVDGDNLLSAGIIVPLAERFDLAGELDKLVLKQLSARIEPDSPGYYAVNLCSGSIRSEAFGNWLEGFLSANTVFANRLVIEVPEHVLHGDESSVRRLQALLAKKGAKLGIDHFGLEPKAFGYLSSLPLYYLKVHRSFTRRLENNADNQFYIKSLVQLAHSRDIKLITEGVETESEWRVLCELGVDCCQGFYLAQPEAV